MSEKIVQGDGTEKLTGSCIQGCYILSLFRTRLELWPQHGHHLFSIKRTHTVLCFTLVRLKIYERLLTLTLDSLTDSLASRFDAYFEYIWTHVETITMTSLAIISSMLIMQNLRVVEYVNRNWLSTSIYGWLYLEAPNQSCNRQPGPLLSERLARAYSSSPAKSHVSALAWERS